jgi:hypothetical protein
LPGWHQFREVLADNVDIRRSGVYPDEAWGSATKDGCRPDIIAIGCVANSMEHPGEAFVSFIRYLRIPKPEGYGFTGPILGLCTLCYCQHIEAGCDEVVDFVQDAAKHILRLVEEGNIGPCYRCQSPDADPTDCPVRAGTATNCKWGFKTSD